MHHRSGADQAGLPGATVIIITEDDASYDSAMAALTVINELRGGHTYAIRSNMEDSPWVKTLWPNENYL